MKKKLELLWQYKLLIYTRFFKALGVLMLLYELLFLVFEDNITNHKTCMFVVIVLLCLFYALYDLLCPPKEIILEINKKTRLYIKKGDIMKENGAIVIPVNEYFDTHLGDNIININSIHGQFLSLYDEEGIKKLRKEIGKQLKEKKALPPNRKRNMVKDLPQDRYPLGTYIRINNKNNLYILVAVTRFNENEHVDVATEEFPEVIRKMLNGIEQLYDGKPVYLPLIGSGHAGYNLSNMQILNTIVQAAHNANKLSLINGLHLYIYSDKQMKSINLNVIKYLYNRWITLK